MKKLWFIAVAIAGLSHAQNADFIDNTNSAGLSSMQRAIMAEDTARMEGLIKNGAGYYWRNDADSYYNTPPPHQLCH